MFEALRRLVDAGIPETVSDPSLGALDNEQILHFDNPSSVQLLVSLQSPTTANSSLQVVDCTSGVAEALANLHLTSRCLVLDVQIENIQKLLVLSSVAIIELVLVGMCSSCVDRKVLITTRQTIRMNRLPTPLIHHRSRVIFLSLVSVDEASGNDTMN